MRTARLTTSLALLLAFTAPSFAQAPVPADLAIRAVRVIDVAAGTVSAEQDVLVSAGRIQNVAAAVRTANCPARACVDGRGKFLMPGLWDMHVHFGGGDKLIDENRDLLPLYLAHGVTTVRDAAGDLSDSVFLWQKQVAAGTLQGPNIYTSGPKLEGKNSIWPGVIPVDSRAEVDAALLRLQGMGANFIKLTDNTLRPALFLYALEQARALHLKTSAHIPLVLGFDEITRSGLGSIEHMAYVLKAGSRRDAEISMAYGAGKLTYAQAMDQYDQSFDAEVAAENLRMFAARGTALSPTLNGSRVIAYLDTDTHQHDAYLRYLGPGLKATYTWRIERAAKDDAAAIAARHARFEKSAAMLPLAQRSGVTILAGTDAGFLNSFNYPGIGLHDELGLYVKYGLTPQQALAASVINGPAFLGQGEHYGAVAAGKAADLLLLDANPLQDIAATRKIAGVAIQGRYLDRAALDALLAAAAKVAAAK